MGEYFKMGKYLESVLESTAATEITDIFLALLMALFVVALVFAIAKKASRFVAYTPNMLTSIGILGTFIGIVIGLMGFDAANIDGSIESLLAGLKTAFITSLAGMGLSILFKMLTTLPFMQQSAAKGVSSSNIGPELLTSMQKQNEQLDMLRIAIAGDEESSVAGQLKLLRSDANDHHTVQRKLLEENATALHSIRSTAEQQRQGFQKFSGKLWTQMEAFAEMLSKSATEQVINALKEVISDFNKNLTEQFGENFKALDSSVQKLVTWQEQYRLQLEQMREQYQQGVQAITQTEASVAHISEESRQIPETMGQLKTVMEVNQHQIEELDRHLGAFKEIRDRAVEAVPEIRQQVDATVTDIREAAIAASEHHSKLLDASDQYIQEHNQVSRDLLEEYVTKTREGIELVRDNLNEGASAVASGLTESAERVKTSIVDGAAEFDDKIQSLSANLISTSDVLSEKSEVISEQLGDAVKVINEQSRDMVEQLIDGNKRVAQHLADGGEELNAVMKQNNEEHNNASRDLLEEYVSKTREGIELVRDKLDQGASAVATALTVSADQVKTSITDGAAEFDEKIVEVSKSLISTSDVLTEKSRDISDQFGDAVKAIHEQSQDTVVQLIDGNKRVAQHLTEGGDEIKESLKQTVQQASQQSVEIQSQVSSAIEQMQTRLESTLEEVFRAQTREMDKFANGVEEAMKTAVDRTGEGVNTQLKMIDEAMLQEIERAMKEMGGALAAITGRFTSDYQTLVSAMDDVVRHGRAA